MLKQADRKRRDEANANATLYLQCLEGQPSPFDKRLEKAVVVLDILSARRKRNASYLQSLTALEAENAELRNRAMELTLEIKHLQIARNPARSNSST